MQRIIFKRICSYSLDMLCLHFNRLCLQNRLESQKQLHLIYRVSTALCDKNSENLLKEYYPVKQQTLLYLSGIMNL